MKSQFSFRFANLLMTKVNFGSYRKFGTAGLWPPQQRHDRGLVGALAQCSLVAVQRASPFFLAKDPIMPEACSNGVSASGSPATGEIGASHTSHDDKRTTNSQLDQYQRSSWTFLKANDFI